MTLPISISDHTEEIQFPDNIPCISDLAIPNSFWKFKSCNLTCQAREQTALLNFYEKTNGDYWKESKNWGNISVSHCQWHGVVCDSLSGHVIALSLKNNGVSGTWNESFGRLTRIMGLCLQWNNIKAVLADILSTLHGPYLISLSISYNKIDGVITWNNIYEFQELQELDLSGNSQLRGELHTQMQRLKKLQVLELGETGVTGAIPESFAALTKLSSIDFTSLKLRGNLTLFLSMPRLTYLCLSGNEIHGHIPIKINTSLPNLRVLNLGYNNLEGAIPDSIGFLAHLKYLNLAGNVLIGFVPSSVRFLTKLDTFIISRTDLIGFSEGTYFNSSNFVHFFAYRSKKFNCSFQRLMQVLHRTKSSLRKVNMDSSQLHGHLTSEIFSFTQLASFDFTYCKLTGKLPEPVTGIKRVQRLNKIVLRGNYLTGSIPSSYSRLQTLYVLDLRDIEQMHGDLDRLLITDYKDLTKEGLNTTYHCPMLKFYHNRGLVYTESSYYHRKYCFCDKGYYGIGGNCHKCLAGGICPGYPIEKLSKNNTKILTTKMVVRVGYWPFYSWKNVNGLVHCSKFSSESQLCNPTGGCVCSANIMQVLDKTVNRTVCDKTCICAVGHTGRFCNQCLHGYFKAGAVCVPCPKGINLKKQTTVIISSLSGVFLLLSITVVLSRKRSKLAVPLAIINILSACLLAACGIIPVYVSQINIVILVLSLGWLNDYCKGLIKIGIFYIQITDSLISSVNIWPNTAYKLHYYVSGPFNFQFESLYCNIPELFTITAHLTAILAFPVVAILLIWTIYLLTSKTALRQRRNTKRNFELKCRTYSLLVLDFSYFPIVKRVLSIFSPCQKLGKMSFMANFVWIDCKTQTHKILLALAGFAVPIYILGIPYLIFLPLLYRNRHKIKGHDSYTNKWLGSLYQFYEPQYRICVKPLMMTLRLLIATALAIIPSNSVFQTIFIVTVVLFAIILVTHTKPYKRDHSNFELAEELYNGTTHIKTGLENMFEIATLSVLILTFILARFYLTSLDKEIKLILIWIITVMNFLFIISLVIAILIRSMHKTKSSIENRHSYILYDHLISSNNHTEERL